MTNNEPDEFDLSNEDAFPDGEECSDMEEMVFEVSDSDRVSTPRTAPVEAPFIKGQILGGRFEVLRSIRDTSVSRIVRAKDRVRGGSDIALEVANRNVLARIENLPDRIHGIVPRLKELSHKVINPLLDFGILPDGRLYFSSQVLGGRTLDSMLANNQPLTTEAAFATTRRLLRALEYGHSLGQVHGTLAPNNILFEDSGEPLEESVRLLRFGYAEILSPNTKQANGQRDLQAIGPLLAQMLVGQPVTGHIHTWWENNAPALPDAAATVVKNALLSAGGEGYDGITAMREAIESLRQFRAEVESPRMTGLIPLALAAGAVGCAAIWFLQKDNRVEASDNGNTAGLETPAAVEPIAEQPRASVDNGDSVVPAPTGMTEEEAGLVLMLNNQIANLRDGLDVTKRALVDLRATNQVLDEHMGAIDDRLDDLESRTLLVQEEQNAAQDRDTVALEIAEQAAADLEAAALLAAELAARESEATTLVELDPQAQVGPTDQLTPDPLFAARNALSLPAETPRDLVATAQSLFSGKASPFGPVGSRATHHTLTAEGEEGWIVITVNPDIGTPAGADHSWVLEEAYFSESGRPLGQRRVRIVQRGGRFEEIDGRAYTLLDLGTPGTELSIEDFLPRANLMPPASLGVSLAAMDSFQQRMEESPVLALVEVEDGRRSWFVPGLGFVRYEDPRRIRRELVMMQLR